MTKEKKDAVNPDVAAESAHVERLIRDKKRLEHEVKVYNAFRTASIGFVMKYGVGAPLAAFYKKYIERKYSYLSRRSWSRILFVSPFELIWTLLKTGYRFIKLPSMFINNRETNLQRLESKLKQCNNLLEFYYRKYNGDAPTLENSSYEFLLSEAMKRDLARVSKTPEARFDALDFSEVSALIRDKGVMDKFIKGQGGVGAVKTANMQKLSAGIVKNYNELLVKANGSVSNEVTFVNAAMNFERDLDRLFDEGWKHPLGFDFRTVLKKNPELIKAIMKDISSAGKINPIMHNGVLRRFMDLNISDHTVVQQLCTNMLKNHFDIIKQAKSVADESELKFAMQNFERDLDRVFAKRWKHPFSSNFRAIFERHGDIVTEIIKEVKNANQNVNELGNAYEMVINSFLSIDLGEGIKKDLEVLRTSLNNVTTSGKSSLSLVYRSVPGFSDIVEQHREAGKLSGIAQSPPDFPANSSVEQDQNQSDSSMPCKNAAPDLGQVLDSGQFTTSFGYR